MADDPTRWRWLARGRDDGRPLVCVLRKGLPQHDSASDDDDEQPSGDEDAEGSGAPSSSSSEAEEEDDELRRPRRRGPDERGGDDDEAWRATPVPRSRQSAVVWRGPSGPTELALGARASPSAAFALFFTRAMEESVVAATNADAARKGRARWRPMGRAELRAYVGLLLLAGVFRSRGEACESLWRAETGRKVFRETMPLARFRAFSAALRFDDRETREARRAAGDRLAPIGDLWRAWTERLPLAYRPGDSVTVDEWLVPFRGRCGFRQYMPCKPARYGLKLWVACDARSSYAWRVQAYTGKREAGVERNLSTRVVVDLTEGLSAGTLVTVDNFFTSPQLAARLAAERGVYLLGTMRANRAPRDIPRALLEPAAAAPCTSRFAFKRDACVVSYAPKRQKGKKNVLLLTTAPELMRVADDAEENKPPALLRYNATKGGVDNLDKVTAAYSVRRRTTRWPMALFHNMLDVSAYNAFVLWRELRPDWLPGKRDRRRRFMEQLGLELTRDLLVVAVADNDPSSGAPVATAAATDELPTRRKRCSVCPRARDVKTRSSCERCRKPLCLGCAALLCPACVPQPR